MRILAISHLYPHANETRYGIFVARQLEAMAACGAEITLIVPRAIRPKSLLRLFGMSAEKSHASPLCKYDGVRAISVPYVTIPGAWYNNVRGLVVERALANTAVRLHQEQKFDVIYATNLFLGGDVAVRLGRRLSIPSTCLAIGTDVNTVPNMSTQLRRTYERIVKGLSGVLACGESLARKIDELRDDRALCVYGVVDLEVFHPVDDKHTLRVELGLPTNKQIVVYAGYLYKTKGLLELIAAFERVHATQPDAVLVLCGGGKDESEIKAAADSSDCSAAIHFLGPIPPDQVHLYLQASDVFTLPSHAEGMPNAVMEAMACGLPVVSTQVGGLPDALENCKGAILVPPKQVEPLAEALGMCLADADKLDQMSEEAKAKATSSFGAVPNAKKILGHLAHVVENMSGGHQKE